MKGTSVCPKCGKKFEWERSKKQYYLNFAV